MPRPAIHEDIHSKLPYFWENCQGTFEWVRADVPKSTAKALRIVDDVQQLMGQKREHVPEFPCMEVVEVLPNVHPGKVKNDLYVE